MKRMQEVHAHDRPREKIRIKGAGCLSIQDLVAAILGTGGPGNDVRSLSKEIAGMVEERPTAVCFSDLAGLKGVGPAKASQIIAALELGRRLFSRDQSLKRKITVPADVLPLVDHLAGKKQEHFICITLSGAHEVLEVRTITVGLLNHSLVHPREVFADAITDRAAAIICVHNHPSGTLEPSSQDLAITRQLAEAGTLLGIRLLDHLIISDNGWLSLKERGLM
jgi:DNA repair protein RadC